MYLKNGNMIITSDINELPLTEIKQGQHLVLLEKKEIGRINEITVDTSISMVCSHIQNDLLYVMECNETYVIGDDRNDASELIYESEDECPSIERKHFHRTYLNLNGGLYNLGDRDGWEYGYRVEELEGHRQQIYDRIFNSKFDWFVKMKHEESCGIFLPIKLDNSTYLVFKITSSFFHFSKWNTMCNVFILQKDSNKEINLFVNFLDFYSEVKKMKKDSLNKGEFEKFDEMLHLINYDISKHLRSSELEQEVMLNKLIEIAQYNVSKQQLKELFSFFYQNEDLKVEICIDSVKKINPGYIVFKDGEPISNYKLDKELKIELSKADAIYKWDESHNHAGINPRSGEYYEDGKISAEPRGFYRDAGGITYPNGNFNSRNYINYDGIFVSVGKDHPEVKELIERKRVVETLTSGA